LESASEHVHIWHRCQHCGAQPIVGSRFECQTCPAGPDNDFCESCYRLMERREISHPARPNQSGYLTPSHTFLRFPGVPRGEQEHWLTVKEGDGTAPHTPTGFVVRPEFRCGAASFFGSYAFTVNSDAGGRPLVLTALHIMDELAKSKGIDLSPGNSSYTGRELPAVVTNVVLYDVFASNWLFADVGTAAPMCILANARVGDPEPRSDRDIAAFTVATSSALVPATLAARRPEVGEPVWLAVYVKEGAIGRTLRCTVVESTAGTLVFRFSTPTGGPHYTSGAPLLNAAGEVVGINVGRGFLDGIRLGHANHVESIRAHLASASSCATS